MGLNSDKLSDDAIPKLTPEDAAEIVTGMEHYRAWTADNLGGPCCDRIDALISKLKEVTK